MGDWAIEFLVYGSASGLIGLFFGFLILRGTRGYGWPFVFILGGVGVLVGGFGGEPVINWLGQKLRDRTEK